MRLQTHPAVGTLALVPQRIMKRLILLPSLFLSIALTLGCSSQPPAADSSKSPTEAYKSLYAAVKAKDQAAIRANLTKRTLGLAEMQSKRAGTPIDRVLENGFTETTFASSIPTIRDERVSGNMGAVEVWNSQKSTWEDLPFILEEGRWKLAVGDIFSGNFQSPGVGRSEKEKEAANALVPQAPLPGNAVNANSTRPSSPKK